MTVARPKWGLATPNFFFFYFVKKKKGNFLLFFASFVALKV
jgi:hypothetical protein